MAEMADNEILKWAVNVIAAAPPMQNLVAFLIIMLLAAPLIRAGWKEFRSKKPEPAAPPTPVDIVAHVMVDQAWLYTTLINIDLKLADLGKRTEMIEKILRRRASKARK